jgi:cell division protein FtsA
MIKPRNRVLAALDIGSSKICCLIAEASDIPGKKPTVLGVGHCASRGIAGGHPVNIEEARQAIGNAVQMAEEQAGFRIESVAVNISGGQLASEVVPVQIQLAGGGHDITDVDLKRLLAMAVPARGGTGRMILHKLPLRYTLDEQTPVANPRGMFAHKLAANVHILSVNSAVVRTLLTCIRHIHLEVEQFFVSPYATAEACLTNDEKALGVTVLDLGGGTTGMAVYQQGHLVFADILPIGGHHITRDLAHGLSTSETDAERLKTLHGTALTSGMEDLDFLDVPIIGETESHHVNHIPRSYLSRIIQPRIEEIFEMVRDKLEECGFNKSAGRLVVLTGGGSQLPVIRDVAGMMLDKKARLGKPAVLEGLDPQYQEAPFSTAIGMLLHLMQPSLWQLSREKPLVNPGGNVIQKALWWVKENF